MPQSTRSMSRGLSMAIILPPMRPRPPRGTMRSAGSITGNLEGSGGAAQFGSTHDGAAINGSSNLPIALNMQVQITSFAYISLLAALAGCTARLGVWDPPGPPAPWVGGDGPSEIVPLS